MNESAVATRIGQILLSASALLVLGIPLAGKAPAESALDLLSGYDAQRLATTHPIADSRAAGEMAKLLFRLRKADEKAIASRVEPLGDDTVDGDVVEVSGTISLIRQYKVPESLIEFLDLEVFQEVVLTDSQNDMTLSIFAPPLTSKVSKGDFIRGNAIVLDTQSSQGVFAAGQLTWIPTSAESVGWKLLADHGVDLSRVAELGSRNRRSLQAADGDAFYQILAAAKQIDQSEDANQIDGVGFLPSPQVVDPVSLLKSPQDYYGQWIRIKSSTVRITRVRVTNATRAQQIGQDYYYQVDASGDLGKTIIHLERGKGDSGAPILISGSYPISLVATELPSFLSDRLKDKDAVVSMISYPVSIDGFFFRLWSYKNEFMARERAGKQVGPLIVVSSWRSREQSEDAGGTIEIIGYGLALSIFAAIIGTVIWTRRNAKQDAKVRESHQQGTKIDLPSC